MVGACTAGESLSICAGCTFLTKRTGHDISKDLADHGVGSSLVTVCWTALDTEQSSDVTMYQRSSTYVMSVTDGVQLVFGGSLRNFYEMCMVTKNLLD